MTRYPLTRLPWWQDLGTRLWRQLYQTAVPNLQLALASGHIDLAAVAITLASVEGLTAVKFVIAELNGWKPTTDTTWGWHLVDRVAPAVGGVLLGAGFATWADVLHADWQQVGSAVLVAALIAAIDQQANPATVSSPEPEAVEDGAWGDV
jgi:hypothetical protein